MSERRTSICIAACSVALSLWVGTASAAVERVDLTLRGQTSLASLGQDGTTKARGQNGDVAILGDIAFVAGGSKNHGALSTPGRICTDYGGVKVVDIANPAAPAVVDQIDIADTKTILTGPKGNPRRTANVPNVASTASSVDVFHNPVVDKDILAITTERCEQSFFDGARIEFWDVTDPDNIPSTPIGVMDPESILNPNCTPGPPVVCPTNQPPDGRWGIFEDIRMFSRNDGPGGSTKVYAIATSPFSIGNTGGVSFVGDFRVLDITNPASPQQVKSFPNSPIGQSTNNGCRTFQAARSAAPTPDRNGAIVSYYDGAQPPDAPATIAVEPLRADFGSPNSAALFRLSLDNLPQYQDGSGTNADPKRFTPNPLVFGYPPAANGGETPAGRVEGNAADVITFTGPNNETMAIVSEEDIDPAVTQVTINQPAVAAYMGRGCANLGAWNKLYLRPGQELTDDVAYVGRGCPASTLTNSTLLAPDPYLENPSGKIALFESGGDGFNGCSLSLKTKRAFEAGAVGVMTNIGGNFLNLSNAGPDGGMPDIPNVGVQLAAFNAMAGGYVPNRIIAGGTALPTTWELIPGSVAANASVKPLASQLGCQAAGGQPAITPENCVAATNETPIKIRTQAAHGLQTGDRVTIAGVKGNTAANGTWTVTVPASTTPPEVPAANVFTLDGSAGNGAYTGGGYVVQCPPNTPNCAAPPLRTDISRMRSVANATDRVAGFQIKPLNRFAVVAGQSYRAGAVLEVAEHVSGTYSAVVEWFTAADASLGTSTIQDLSAVTPRTAFGTNVTAPASATKATVKILWSGATAEGTGFADSLSFVPAGTQVTLKDNQGAWGEQKIVNFSVNPPAVVGTYQSPRAKVWPPPGNGVFMPREARMFDNELAFTTWMTDGLRVLDVTNPATPNEVGSFLPPGVPDPSPGAGAGPNNAAGGPVLFRGFSWPTQTLINGVDVRKLGADSARIVVSDINGGLYVLDANIRRPSAAAPPPPAPAPAPPPPPATAADTVAAVLSGLSIRPSSFKALPSGASIGSRGRATVRYRLSENATTTFTVERVLKGRRRGRSCQAPSAANRRGAVCTRYVKVAGSFRHSGRTGANSFRFTGRIAGRRLGAGSYRMLAVTRDAAGNRGAVKRASFKVKR